jgi:hypothetical protein
MTVQLLEHNFSEEMPASCDRIAYVRMLNTDPVDPESPTAEIPTLSLEAGRLTLFQGPATQSLTSGRERVLTFRWRSPHRSGQTCLQLKLINGRSGEVPLLSLGLNVTKPIVIADLKDIRIRTARFAHKAIAMEAAKVKNFQRLIVHYPCTV